jgi:hypothetical protein
MLIYLKELRQLIRQQLSEQILKDYVNEHILSAAVPDFVLTQQLDKIIDIIRQNLLKYIYMYHSNSQKQRLNAEERLEEMLSEFQSEIKKSFESNVSSFISEI